jgi:hypothetical protein
VFILPAAALGGWGITQLVNALLPATMYFAKLLVNGGIFTLFFLVLLLLVDVPLRTKAKILSGKFITLPFAKLKRA